MNADEIFATALDIADPAERNAYLDCACAGSEPLRQEVDSLLAAHERIDDFMRKRPTLPTRVGSALGVPPSGGAGPEPAEAGTTVPLAEKPGDCIGRYKLLEQIGEGGFGVVWMAEQKEPVRRRVALKIIKLGMDTRQVVARFEAERQALALMDHLNIARVFDGGTTQSGRPYFVMELVKGIPITKFCDEEKLSIRERLDLFVPVCQAIQHAHQKGIIHRDLTPSNILVTEQDGHPVPKVIDFGIAKATEGRLTDKTLFTAFQQWIGTPAYMSPEQAGLGSLDIDTRSDIYSLGVVLYELLTGHPPFDTKELLKEGYETVLRTIRETEPLKPSTRLKQERAARPGRAAKSEIRESEIDPDVDWIVMKALEKDRARRYETVSGLAMDMQRYLADDAVLARAPSTGYRLKKFVRKHRGSVAAAAGFVALLTAATAVSALLAVQAHRAQARAEKAEAGAKQNERKSQESEAKAQAVLQALEKTVLDKMNLREGLHNPIMMRALSYLENAYIVANQCADAERLYRECLDRLRKRGHAANSEILYDVLFGLSHVLEHQGKLAEAESALRECLRERSSLSDWHTFRVRALLGRILLVQKKYLEAEPMLIQGYEGMISAESSFAGDRVRQEKAVGECIVQLYTDWGNKEKVDEWRRKLMKETNAPAASNK